MNYFFRVRLAGSESMLRRGQKHEIRQEPLPPEKNNLRIYL